MENEIWKQCGESKRCFYEISSKGNVKSISKVTKKEKILKPIHHIAGYLYININSKFILIHKLMAYTFIGPRPDGLEIDHIDRNKLNNQLDNLRYCTHSENNINRDCYRSDILETDPKERERILKAKSLNIKINCVCGSITTKANKSQHEKSKKHLSFIRTRNL
jgi:hypothetical protein